MTPKKTPNDLALKDLIKQARESHNLSQIEAAAKCGLGTQAYLSMVEAGLKVPELGKLPAMARTFKIPLARLVYRYLVESKTIANEARPDLINVMAPNVPSGVLSPSKKRKKVWAAKLDALIPEYRDAVLEFINTLYTRQLREDQATKREA